MTSPLLAHGRHYKYYLNWVDLNLETLKYSRVFRGFLLF